jgi:hypothetical protein
VKEIMKSKVFAPILLSLVAMWLVSRASHAQSAPSGGAAPGGGAPSGGTPGSGAPSGGSNPASGEGPTPGAGAPAPSPISPGAIYVPPYGTPVAPTTNQNAHLPSSSQPSNDISRSQDGFDFAAGTGGPTVVRGNANGPFSISSSDRFSTAEETNVPPVHVVKRGDTLWDLCDRYFRNPWEWPRVWSYNPELQNPHWIYPGDQIRMQGNVPPGAPTEPGAGAPGATGARRPGGGTTPFTGRQRGVPANTVFLRDQGYIDDDVKDVWGEVSGSPDDQLLLSDGDNAYLEIKPEHDVKPGQELTVFRPLVRTFKGDAKGTLVAILGTARVEKWDPQTRIARVRLTESLDVIERGAKVGPVGRRFEVVPPTKNQTELWGHVAASVYPHVLYGQNQVVFIDKGQQDGLVPGNRLFAVSRGDEYRKTLPGASQFAGDKVYYDSDRPPVIEKGGALGHGDESKYPEEVVGEIRVLSVREHTAACLVVSANHEIEPGQRVVARKGY